MRLINGMVIFDDEGDIGSIIDLSGGKSLPAPDDRTVERMIQWFNEAIDEVTNLPGDGEAETLFRQIYLEQQRDKLIQWCHAGIEAPATFEIH